jgi:hypothetical protein
MALDEHFKLNYALRKSNVVPVLPLIASAHYSRILQRGIAFSDVLFWMNSGSTTASRGRILPSVILFNGGLHVKHNFPIFFVSLEISLLFPVCFILGVKCESHDS